MIKNHFLFDGLHLKTMIMKKTMFLFMALSSSSIFGQPQSTIDIYESTLKVGGMGTEEYLCGFSEGDQLIFNFEEVNGKELKEIEILEYPSASKFMDYKTSNISNKTLNISNTGIYVFRFSNSALGGRICKIKIQRVPKNEETKNFNTTVYWRNESDTTYIDTEEKYIIKVDTIINNITDQVAKVHSYTHSEGSRTSFNFVLPSNTIAWSYYIGVDQASQKVFADATQKLAETASPIASKIPNYGPLAALALNGASYLVSIQTGENVKYWFVDGTNQSLFNSGQQFMYFKNGNVINDFSRMTSPLSGQYFLCLYNDNNLQAIDVTIKITAVCINEQWGTRSVRKMNVTTFKVPYLKNQNAI
jgi:hypothetical protein